LKSDSWVGNDGQTRFTNEINANQIVFLDSGPAAEGGPPSEAAVPGASDMADDLPW
jgi:single-stranded DNA-binding protein